MKPAYSLSPPQEQAPLGAEPFHIWRVPDGSVWAEFHRRSGTVTIRFPDMADFDLHSAGGVICRPVPGLTTATREHLFLNQVLPLVQSRSGSLSFHASAVAAQAGAVAFVGRTGRGKSTLAAAFAADGLPFITDDGLVLTESDGTYLVQPSHPSIRLWEDSREAVMTDEAESAAPVTYTSKVRLLAGESLPFHRSPLPLKVAYFLGEGQADAAQFVPLRGAELIFEWVQHSFLLDLDDSTALQSHFSALARFAEGVPCWRLDYPRRYDALEDVRHAILDHAARGDCR